MNKQQRQARQEAKKEYRRALRKAERNRKPPPLRCKVCGGPMPREFAHYRKCG